MAKNKNLSGYDVMYEFDYKGKKETFFYDIPYETFMDGVREYFDNQMVTIDGKDNDIWNILVELECVDTIFDIMEDWFKDYCEEAAYEEYKEYIEWEYEEEFNSEEED